MNRWRMLWLAVIAQAVTDSASKSEKLHVDARAWIETEGFLEVCKLAEVPFQKVAQAIKSGHGLWTERELTEIESEA